MADNFGKTKSSFRTQMWTKTSAKNLEENKLGGKTTNVCFLFLCRQGWVINLDGQSRELDMHGGGRIGKADKGNRVGEKEHAETSNIVVVAVVV